MPPLDPERLARVRAHLLAATATVSVASGAAGCDRVRALFTDERPTVNEPVTHTINEPPERPTPNAPPFPTAPTATLVERSNEPMRAPSAPTAPPQPSVEPPTNMPYQPPSTAAPTAPPRPIEPPGNG